MSEAADPVDYARGKALYLALLERPVDERQAQLDTLRLASPTLAGWLEQMLSAADRPLSWIDGDDGEAPIDGYEILEPIGRGGMGEVHLALRQVAGHPQRVALKRLRFDHRDRHARERFAEETRLLAQLSHPGIAPLLDAGTDARGRPYLVTPYIQGQPIDQWCTEQRADVRQRVQLVSKVAAAVADAHAHLVIHCDIKPANILVTADGEPVLLDFGIARSAVATAGEQEWSALTLGYAAPEQLTPPDQRGPLGAAVDVHALGVLAFELLCGHSPYRRRSDYAAQIAAMREVQPPPLREQADVVRGVDRDLAAIVGKALRQNPAERYPSAEALQADLRAWLTRRPVQARAAEPGYRARHLLRRRWPWLLGSLLVMAAIGWHWRVLNQQLQVTAAERDKASATAKFFADLFELQVPAQVDSGQVSAIDLLHGALDRLRVADDRPVAIRASLLFSAGRALSRLGDVGGGAQAKQEALDLLLSSGGDHTVLINEIHVELASDLKNHGQLARACEHVQKATPALADTQAYAPHVHRAHAAISAICAEEAGDVEAARAAYQRVIDRAEEAVRDERERYSIVAAMSNLAGSYSKSDPGHAEALYRQALDYAQRHDYHEARAILPMKLYLARLLIDDFRLDEAEALLEPALVEGQAWFGEKDEWGNLMLTSAGLLDALQGRSERSVQRLDSAAAYIVERVGDDHPWTFSVQVQRVVARLSADDWAGATELAESQMAWLRQREQLTPAGMDFLELARAYAQTRAAPKDSERLEQLRMELASRTRAAGWRSHLIERWAAWAAAASDPPNGGFSPPGPDAGPPAPHKSP
ncbi:MAG: protein kinase [Xanthomonadales bacterium]|nr:protein kinase [Xanthomonadales bacterium]